MTDKQKLIQRLVLANLFPKPTLAQVAMLKLSEALHSICEANNGVRVYMGGDPGAIQITQGQESYCLRTDSKQQVHISWNKLPRQCAYSLDDSCTGKVSPDPKKWNVVPAPRPTTGAQYTGDTCSNCHGSRVRRNGTCGLCEDCGSTTGCS